MYQVNEWKLDWTTSFNVFFARFLPGECQMTWCKLAGGILGNIALFCVSKYYDIITIWIDKLINSCLPWTIIDYFNDIFCQNMNLDNNSIQWVLFCWSHKWLMSTVLDTVKPVCNDHLYYKLPVIYSVMCFNGDWRYHFTLVNNSCLLELI